MSGTPKVCALCGSDCADRARIRDAKGRYYCRECYEKARQKAADRRGVSGSAGLTGTGVAQPAEPARRQASKPADPMQDLLRAMARDAKDRQDAASSCPSCGATIGGGVICMSCGYDTRTGKRLAMQVDAAPISGGQGAMAAGASRGMAVLGGLLGGSTPLILSVVAGVLGAAIWAAIAYYADLQIGWIAILVGGMVGLAMVAGGGSGQMAGLLAAGIAVGAICAGKVAAVHFSIGPMTQKMVAARLTQADYERYKEAAAAFSVITDKSKYPAFMAAYGFGGAETMDDVTAEDIAEFEAGAARELRDLHDRQLSFDQWKVQMTAALADTVRSHASFGEMLKLSLRPMDILFFLLAIGAAYRIPAGNA